MEELRDLRYCGHCRLVGRDAAGWQATGEVLSRFDSIMEKARGKYESFVAEGIAAGKRPDLVGGGLVRSAGGWEKIALARKYGEHLKSDERILGDSAFVEEVLGRAGEHFVDRYLCREV